MLLENFWITKKMGVFLCCVKLEILQPQGQLRTRLLKGLNEFSVLISSSIGFIDFNMLCTGLVKITKKHDKRSGSLIRLPFIQGVLQEPFFSTEVVKQLVEECAMTLEHIFSNRELVEIEHLESTYVKLTSLALQVLEEIRSGSSTVGPHSLPPLQTAEELNSIPVVEQAAK